MVLTALVCCQPLCQVEQVAMGLAILPETEAKGRASAVSAVPRACRRQAGQAAMRLEMARLMVVKLVAVQLVAVQLVAGSSLSPWVTMMTRRTGSLC